MRQKEKKREESYLNPRPGSSMSTNKRARLGPHVDERNYQNCELKDDKYQSAADCCNKKFEASGKIPKGCYATETTVKDQNGNDYKLLRAEKPWRESDTPDYGAQRKPSTLFGHHIPSVFT